jgi:membrane fusion protein, multidrug efflux system
MKKDSTSRFGSILVVAATACGGVAGETMSDSAGAAGAPRIVNVEVITAVAEPFEDVLTLTGTVEAERAVTAAAEESGVVREVIVEKGRRVRAGQPIVRIDDRVLRAQYDQARSEAALARETFNRQRRLWEDEKIGSEMNYLRARHEADAAAAVERVLAARLDRTMVRAPTAGVLDDRFVEIGSMVGPGSPVARIIAMDTLKVAAGVAARYAREIRVGSAVTLSINDLPDGEVTGLVRFVGATVNEHNRTFPVEIAIPNAAGTLKPGMIARVRLVRETLPDAVLVPREAVLRRENGYSVFLVREVDGRRVAQETPVVTGAGAQSRVVITAGVVAGDLIVVLGQHQVGHGDVVHIVAGERPPQVNRDAGAGE